MDEPEPSSRPSSMNVPPTTSDQAHEQLMRAFFSSVLWNLVSRIQISSFLYRVLSELKMLNLSDRIHVVARPNEPTPETVENFEEISQIYRENMVESIGKNCILRKRTDTEERPEYEDLMNCPFWSSIETVNTPTLRTYLDTLPICGLSEKQDILVLELSTDPRRLYIPYKGITVPATIVVMLHNVFHKSGCFLSIVKVTSADSQFSDAVVPSGSKPQQPKYILIVKRGLYPFEEIDYSTVPVTGDERPIAMFRIQLLKYPNRTKYTLRMNGARSQIKTLASGRLLRQTAPECLAIFNLDSLVKIASILTNQAFITGREDGVVPSVTLDPNDVPDFQYVEEDYEDYFDQRGIIYYM